MSVQTKAPESQFAYVVLAARRARQIMAGAPPMVENPRTQKATRIACEEVNQGLIEYEFTELMPSEAEREAGKRQK
ncbi:MAG TPA: DNA-directed RNA polymerase subunit omega [Terriglobales bacterium]|nr:DNA-directed RNA polymerase subunit omega [Terriglobales bacterium]